MNHECMIIHSCYISLRKHECIIQMIFSLYCEYKLYHIIFVKLIPNIFLLMAQKQIIQSQIKIGLRTLAMVFQKLHKSKIQIFKIKDYPLHTLITTMAS